MDYSLSSSEPSLLTVLPRSKQMDILPKTPPETGSALRWTRFMVRKETEEGMLLYNTLTLEMIHVPARLLPSLAEPSGELREALRKKWFLVPADMDEHKTVREMREILRLLNPPAPWIEKYTVFTTTACNARCAYCFEKDWKPRTMTDGIADKAAAYMLSHSAGHHFVIDWFGGEPLVNARAIDRICHKLNDAGAEFTSNMTTNGYLFDEELIRKAKDQWQLQKAQITLDGVGEAYNRTKNYKAPGEDPFLRVIRNIRVLAKTGISVIIRMNYDVHNLEAISALADYLIGHFAGMKNILPFPAPLFEDPDDPAKQRTTEEREVLKQFSTELRGRFTQAGMLDPTPLPREHVFHMCMADSGNMITILPDGKIGLCERYAHDHFIGDLSSPSLDRSAMEAQQKLREDIPICEDCPLYPDCIRLKICTSQICHPQRREEKTHRLRVSMQMEWERFLRRSLLRKI